VRPRTRKTSATLQVTKRKSRKAASEPPKPQSPPTLPYADEFITGVPQSKFEPDLPPNIRVTRGMRTSLIHQNTAAQLHGPSIAEPMKEEGHLDDFPQGEESNHSTQEVIEVSSDSPDEGKEQERMVAAASRRIKEGDAVVAFTTSNGSSRWFLRFLTSVCLLVAIGVTYDYKTHSAPIGFCDTGKDTNAALESGRQYWAAVESCNKENRSVLYSPDMDSDGTPCPLLNPVPRPDNCTPCPKHATCSQHTVACETGYVVRPHPLLSFLPRPSTSTSTSWAFPDKWDADFSVDYIWQGISLIADGLPGMGPVAFPPRCAEDPKRKRHIGALGKAVESLLGQERGRRVCAGLESTMSQNQMSEAEEARIWGVDIDTLKDAMKRKTAVSVLIVFAIWC
jgi:Man1-Src1p-C-terminal domain